jgi:hypothetical protein
MIARDHGPIRYDVDEHSVDQFPGTKVSGRSWGKAAAGALRALYLLNVAVCVIVIAFKRRLTAARAVRRDEICDAPSHPGAKKTYIDSGTH